MKGRKRRSFTIFLAAVLCVSSYNVSGASTETFFQHTENSEPAAVEGELLVTFENDTTEKKAEEAAEKVDGELTDIFDRGDAPAIIKINEDADVDKIMDKLESLSQVKAVQPNYIYYADDGTDDEDDAEDSNGLTGTSASEYDTWHLDYMQVQEAWDLIDSIKPESERRDEDKIKVATLDAGITRHEDLNMNTDWENCVTVIESEQTTGEEVSVYPAYDKPAASHGNSVAGVIAATSYNGLGTAGVAAGNNNDLIELMAIKVFETGNYKGQDSATTLDIIKGLQYACEKDARVINMCLGHEPGAMDAMGNLQDDVLLENAINRAVTEYDVVITCSAGNNKDMRTWYPSDFDSVISVINSQRYTNAWSEDVKGMTSSYGLKKDISAPGVGVYTIKGTTEYKTSSGTSIAVSGAAGVAALVRYVAPDLTADQVKEILYSTATDVYIDGYDIYTGHGNINAYRAVAKAAGVTLPENTEKMKKTTVTAESLGINEIRVSWQAVENADGYYVCRSTARDGAYKVIAHITDGEITEYIDYGRKFNKKYYYAVETLGTSETTKEKIKSSMSRPKSCRTVPDALDFSIGRADSYSLKLSWDQAEGASGYRIFRSATKNGVYKRVNTITKGKTVNWIDKDRKPGRKYYYKIRVYKNSNGKKVWGELSDFRYKKVKPVKTKGFKIIRQGKKAKLTWKQDATVSGYKIYRSINDNGKWRQIKNIGRSDKSIYTTKKLKKGKIYSFKVRSYVVVNGKTVYGAYSSVKHVER